MPFRHALLGWFRRHRRDLPWRRTRDPYRIWISEVMLQQTRVAAVVPYYERFVRRFPNFRALARARVSDVLKHWAGLGYYTRARNLHRAAKRVVAHHGGRFPRERVAAMALPGVGRYTAAAVLSIAYGEPLAVLDGNVARVVARLAAVRGDLRAPRRWRQLERKAQELLATGAAGEWNQAMMELGATICTPRAPRCGECPLARWCCARKLGIQERLPAARVKRATEKVTLAAAVMLDAHGRTLLVRREGGLFSGMWQFPAVEVRRDARSELLAHLRTFEGQAKRRHSTELGRATNREEKDDAETPRFHRGKLRAQRGAEKNIIALPTVKHTVTFREITLHPFLLRVTRLLLTDGARAVPLARLDTLPISSATRKIAVAAIQWRRQKESGDVKSALQKAE